MEPRAAVLSQMTLASLEADAEPHGLFVMGACHKDGGTLALLGADAGMWPVFLKSAEFQDGQADPLDRWSKRVIGDLADQWQAQAVFPSDGPPYAPFIAWAQQTGRFWTSPTGMLVHDKAGLMISIRGALLTPDPWDFEDPAQTSPCEQCAAPCATACPVGALSASEPYDVPACKDFIRTDPGQACLTAGCHARRACPVSAAFGRDPEQSGFHMLAFMGG